MGPQEIIRTLDQATHKYHSREVFADWIGLVEATLRMLPVHLESVQTTGMLAEDDEDAKGVWERLRPRYEKPDWDVFRLGLKQLLQASYGDKDEPLFLDTIGEIYQIMNVSSARAGQFFTPISLSKVMAQLAWSGLDITAEILANAGKPITVADPACGSGAMFVATASVLPPWVIRNGLVEFHGTDIDPLCCAMARTNLLLYGLRGTIECRNALVDPVRERVLETTSRDAPTASHETETEQLILF